jgi:hypothetical protein
MQNLRQAKHACDRVAGGFERLMLSLERKGLFPDTDKDVQVFVAMGGTEVRKEAIQLRGFFVTLGFELTRI